VPLQARAVPSFGCFGLVQGIRWHGRATAGTGRANAGTGRANAGTGRAKLLVSQAQNFFSSFS